MTSSSRARSSSKARIVLRQIRFEILLLLRSPSAPFFTLVVPFMLLVTLNLVYGSRQIPTRSDMQYEQFYFTGMMAFATINACYINVINGTTLARQAGMLKRMRGTPMPSWVYLAGRTVSAGIVAMCSVLVVAIVSMTVFGTDMPLSTVPGTVASLFLGVACFSSIGLAVTPLVPTAEAALPIAYGSFLPLSFISDIFFPGDTNSAWLHDVASVFPLRPLAHSLASNAAPGADGLGFHWGELGVLAAWTAGAAVLLSLFFQWEPARPTHERRRRASSTNAQ